MKEVKAYKTADGELFTNKKKATEHEKELAKNRNIQSILDDKDNKIKQYVLDEFNERIKSYTSPSNLATLDMVGTPFIEGWGWDCDHKDNPLDKCVYVWIDHEDEDGEQSCAYCGGPEERK